MLAQKKIYLLLLAFCLPVLGAEHLAAPVDIAEQPGATFHISAYDPPANALAISSDTDVSVTFSTAFNPSTVTTTTFSLRSEQTGTYDGSFSFGLKTVQFSPNQPFKAGETLFVTGSSNVKAFPDVSLVHHTWQFTAATARSSATMFAHLSTPNFGDGFSYDVALGDLDGDGDLDAVVANINYQIETVWLNDGSGAFSAHLSSPTFGTGNSTAVALGDLDGDGDLDAVVTHYGTPGGVYLNDGLGGFSAHPTTPSFGGNNDSMDVALGDLDGDGDLDAIVANSGQPEYVYLNDGLGSFSAHPTTPVFGNIGNSQDVAVGDLDGDGDLDAVVANYDDQAETVWLNNGSGTFSAHASSPTFGTGNSTAVVLGDLDGDGDLDAVVANDGQPQTVWLNDGLGNFSPHASSPSFGSGYSTAVALGDLDGDGDLDAIVENYGQVGTVYLNDGLGSFSANPTTPFTGFGSSTAVALGDLDGDSDLDAVVANEGLETVWMNGQRLYLPLVKR